MFFFASSDLNFPSFSVSGEEGRGKIADLLLRKTKKRGEIEGLHRFANWRRNKGEERKTPLRGGGIMAAVNYNTLLFPLNVQYFSSSRAPTSACLSFFRGKNRNSNYFSQKIYFFRENGNNYNYPTRIIARFSYFSASFSFVVNQVWKREDEQQQGKEGEIAHLLTPISQTRQGGKGKRKMFFSLFAPSYVEAGWKEGSFFGM